MKVYSKYLDIYIDLSKERTNTLILESPKTYREAIQSLYKAFDGQGEEWLLSDGEKILNVNKEAEIVNSIFSLDFDNRKIQKAIIDKMYENAVNEENYEKTRLLMAEIEQYYYELEWGVDYNIKIKLEDFHDILKAGIEGIIRADNLMEQLVDYIKISARLLINRILVLIGFQEYFSKEEWFELEKAARYEDIYLFCIEKRGILENDNRVVIDSDDCQVI